jgi:sigma-B regulation protein RsbU (phosphoserine phosphatase)
MTNGLPLGVIDDFKFESKKIQLKKGDQILLYTDGVVEAFNLEETAYGEEKFENFLTGSINLSVEKLIKDSFHDVCGFVDGAPQSDDITLLGITFKG